jgi:cob(I)alamin adenosyltransferase
MATFEAQVEGLTSLSIDGSSAPTQTELTQFLTDGAKEILTSLPDFKKELYTSSNELNGSSVNYTVAGSEVFSVTRDDGTINQPCRRIPAALQGRVRDSGDMMAASQTDPVYYIANNLLSVVPEPSNSRNAHVQALAYPAVAYGDSAVAKFPDEAEYLIPLYAAIKSLQNAMAAKAGNTDITTALTAVNAEIDETLTIADSAATEIGLANGEIDKAYAEVALANIEVDLMNAEVDLSNAELAEALVLVDSGIDTATAAIATAAGRVNTAVALANTQFDSAVTANTAEDIELAASHVNAGNGFLSEAQSSLGEAQGYVNEVSARVSQVQSQISVAQGFLGTSGGYGAVAQGYLGTATGYINTAQGYISTANAYLSQIQAKINISQAYANEAQTRLNVISTEYAWMEKQQAKLQADYDKGIQIVRGG